MTSPEGRAPVPPGTVCERAQNLQNFGMRCRPPYRRFKTLGSGAGGLTERKELSGMERSPLFLLVLRDSLGQPTSPRPLLEMLLRYIGSSMAVVTNRKAYSICICFVVQRKYHRALLYEEKTIGHRKNASPASCCWILSVRESVSKDTLKS